MLLQFYFSSLQIIIEYQTYDKSVQLLIFCGSRFVNNVPIAVIQVSLTNQLLHRLSAVELPT